MPTFAQLNGFNPENETTIVCNAAEFPSGLVDFVNFAFGFDVPHNTLTVPVRAPADIHFIVLHETSVDSGGGFRPPHTAHFVVLRNGVIRQFNDLCETQIHAGIFNAAGIGIEFVNRDWDDGKGVAKTAIPARFAEANGYVHAFWGDGYNLYKLPPLDQLERLVELLNRLLNQRDDLQPFLEPAFLQYVSYDNIQALWQVPAASTPATAAEKEALRYFIWSNAYHYMLPTAFDNLGSGILSHNSISNIGADGFTDEDAHSDGSFLSLYALLRLYFDYAPAAAREKAIWLMKNRLVKATTKAALQWHETDPVTKRVTDHTGSRVVYLLDLDGV